MPAADLGPVLIEGDIADPVGAVFDAPVPARVLQEPRRVYLLLGQARHSIDGLAPVPAGLLLGHPPLHLEHAGHTRPVAIAHQGVTRGQLPPLDAPMPYLVSGGR